MPKKTLVDVMDDARREELKVAARYSNSHGNGQLPVKADEVLGLIEIAETAAEEVAATVQGS